MSSSKYLGEQNKERHGGILRWFYDRPDLPPIRSSKPFMGLTHEQVEEMGFQHDFHRRTFKLWEAADLAAYTDIRDRAVNGMWYIVTHTARHWVPEQNDEIVILEWIQTYGDPHGSAGSSSTPR